MPNESMRDLFMLALLTGARRSNVCAMAWSDIDLEAGVWRISKTKNGTPQNVTLSPEAVQVLKARKEGAGASPFVFPGTGKTGHIVEPKGAWAKLLEAELEEKHDVYIYEVELLTVDGVVRELDLDAATGRLLKDEEDD